MSNIKIFVIIGSYLPILIENINLKEGKVFVSFNFETVELAVAAFNNIKKETGDYSTISFCGDLNCMIESYLCLLYINRIDREVSISFNPNDLIPI